MATTTSTIPIGFLKQTIAAATDGSTPALTPISIPFYSEPTYTGLIVSIDSANSCSLLGAAFSLGEFAAAPSYLRFMSGGATGRSLFITNNTANQLTLDTRGYSFTSANPAANELLIQGGELVEIVPAHTLGSVFGTSSVALQTGASAELADNVLLFDGTNWLVYFHDGTSWKTTGSNLSQDKVVLAPEVAFFVVRRAQSSVDLTIAGTVPSTTERADLPAPGSTLLANRFPSDLTIADFNLQLLGNWKAGVSASASDHVLIWTGSTWDSLYYNGSHWRIAGSLLDADSESIPAGGALFLSRSSSASNATLSLALPYSITP